MTFDNESQSRLQKLQRQKTTGRQTIESLLARHINRTPKALVRLSGGETNEVYDVEFFNGVNVILRISHGDENTFAPEAWAMEQVRQAGVPVAATLAFGEMDLNGGFYSIQSRLKGRSLSSLLAQNELDLDRARRIVNTAGELLRQIHDVTTSGYGYLDERGAGAWASPVGWIRQMTNRRSYYEPLFSSELNLSPQLLKQAFGALTRGADLLGTQPHLLHGDFVPSHILIGKSDRITGIIDFEEAASGDVTLDFTAWQAQIGTELWDPLLEGYAGGRPLPPDFNERLRVMGLYKHIHMLNYYVRVAPYQSRALQIALTIKELL